MFFSGFCLSGEKELFSEYLNQKEESIAGFSYGAIGALKKAFELRPKRLILLSPAFYAYKDSSFKEQQIKAFETDRELYMLKLLKKSGLSEEEGRRFGKEGSSEQLRELLYFEWQKSPIKELSVTTKIEIYIGTNDRVVEPESAIEFFSKFGELKILKDKNHILR